MGPRRDRRLFTADRCGEKQNKFLGGHSQRTETEEEEEEADEPTDNQAFDQ